MRKLSLWDQLKVVFIKDKLIFKGAFLPADVHICMPFGLKSGFIDFHLTREAYNSSLNAPWIRINHDELPQILDIILKRIFKNIISIQELNPDWYNDSDCFFSLFPLDTTNESKKLENEIRSSFDEIIIKKGGKKEDFYIEPPPGTIERIINDKLIDNKYSFLNEWLNKNTFPIRHINFLGKIIGIVSYKNETYGLVRLPNGNKKFINLIFT